MKNENYTNNQLRTSKRVDLETEVKRIEEGSAWDKSDEVVQIRTKKPFEKVIPVRLTSGDWGKLREEAKILGIGPTTLARMWIMERLRLGTPGEKRQS
jgi:hypothetical protein